MDQPANPFEVEVPAPLSKFMGATVIDPQNQVILASQEQLRILDKHQLKQARKRLDSLNDELSQHGDIDSLIDERKRLYAEFADERVNLHNLKQAFETCADDEKRLLKESTAIVKANLHSIRRDLSSIDEKLLPLRPLIVRRNIIRARIDEHLRAVEDEQKQIELTKDMATEANYFADIIQRTFDQLGYCYDYSTRKGKLKRHSVRFERIIATPDTVQFKIYVTKQALIRGTINKLPNGVKVSDLIKDETLTQLTSACERPVRCSSRDKAIFKNGLWYEIDRTGVVDGIPLHITYKAIMAAYPGAKEHHKIPLLLGVKQGRHVNKVHLASNPHFLIAGQTGSGKTVAYHGIIATLIANYSPDEVRLIFIDLKEGVAFRKYQSIPHILGGIVEESKDVPPLLSRLEALRRWRMIQIRAIAEDIDEYNALVSVEKRIPRIIVCFDEYGALNGTDHSANSYAFTSQLAKKARAAGIHLIIGAQTPYVADVPQSVKSNLTFSLVGKQKTLGASLSSTGDRQAYDLPDIPGRMISEGRGGNHQVQLPLVETEDIIRAMEAANEYAPGIDLFAVLDDTDDESVLESLEAAVPPFTMFDFIDITLSQLDGVISPRKIFEMLDDNRITLNALKTMADEIKRRDEVSHGGKSYQLQRYGKGFKLSHKHVSTNEDVSPIVVTPVITDVYSNGHVEEELAL